MNHFKFYNDLSKDLVRNKYSIIRFLWRDGRVAEGAPLLRVYRIYLLSWVQIPLSPPNFFVFSLATLLTINKYLIT